MEMQLSLDWPLRLDGICPLQLMIFGRVVRSAKEGCTLRIVRYEFRTRAFRASPPHKPIRPGAQIGDPHAFEARLTASAPRE